MLCCSFRTDMDNVLRLAILALWFGRPGIGGKMVRWIDNAPVITNNRLDFVRSLFLWLSPVKIAHNSRT